MKVSVNGNQISIVSEVTKNDLKLVEKHIPAALALKDEEGNVVYRVAFSDKKPGSINGVMLAYDSETRGEEPKAALYIQDDKIPATNAAEYVADKWGKALSMAQEIEAAIPEYAAKATTLYNSMVSAITVEG